MQYGKLNANWYEDNSFDIITSFEVLEHINNPLDELEHIKRILRKGGLFYVTTPNFNALFRFILKYNIIEYPEHLCYYTRRTLNFLLTEKGFDKKKIVTTGISFTRVGKSMHPKSNAAVAKNNEKRAKTADEYLRNITVKMEIFRGLMNYANFFLTLFGIGDSLKGWFVKKE